MSKTIPLRMPEDLLREVDDLSNDLCLPRTDTIRLSVREGIKMLREKHLSEPKESKEVEV